MSEASSEERIVRARKVRLAQSRVLERIAQYDPELAEELLSRPESVEDLIAEELVIWHRVKKSEVEKMSLKQLLVAFEFWRDVFKMAIEFMASVNTMFMQQFMQSYAQVAEGVRSRVPLDAEIAYVKTVEKVVSKILKKIEEVSKVGGGGQGGR